MPMSGAGITSVRGDDRLVGVLYLPHGGGRHDRAIGQGRGTHEELSP
jgi:hypothetical protein